MKIYRGTRGSTGTRVDVLTTWGASSLTHHVRHSPDGFEWGYQGSGPAELARCLLIDALGAKGVCQICQGTGIEAGKDGTCSGECDDGCIVIPPMYQAFKRDVVSRLSSPVWTLEEDEIQTWVSDWLAEQIEEVGT